MEQSKHGQGITSVKVHHQPGGKQTHNIFGDSSVDVDRFGGKGQKPVVPVAAEPAKTEEEEKKDEDATTQQAAPTVAAGARP